MMKKQLSNWKERLRASGIHMGISLSVAALAALLVFGIWYPHPYGETSGGRELFLILIAVDVVLGPLITFVIFNQGKQRTVLRRDLATIGTIQLLALLYGLWTVCIARPVHLVFEFDRFRVVHAFEVPEEMLTQMVPQICALPWMGPATLAVRPFKDAEEEGRATLMALQGLHLSARPDLWEPYGQARERVLAAAKPMADLRQRFPQQMALIDAAVADAGTEEDTLRYLPMVARKSFWTVLVDGKSAEVRGFIPLDSF